jgi:peptidoglycan/xylan/chitin deacetylase (PgdA/CDA1 family)
MIVKVSIITIFLYACTYSFSVLPQKSESLNEPTPTSTPIQMPVFATMCPPIDTSSNSLENAISRTKESTITISPIIEIDNKSKGVPILYYHTINDNITGIEELFVSPKEFEKQMKFLRENNYNVISFKELGDYDSYDKPVIITFDDGYEDNYYNAYPILKKYNFKATIFLSVDAIDKPLFLKKAQITEMGDLIDFESHTLSHPYLTQLNNKEAAHELSESKKQIEEITGKQVNVLAYPIGDFDRRIIEIASKYYKYAVLNYGGTYYKSENDYEIKRTYVSRYLDVQGFIKKLK